ncbi:MAG: hypothetical protein J0H57_14275, partial [Rhodospirillales bacterium]|nr:hypothetical protein [Rhodospirillales bacterium]
MLLKPNAIIQCGPFGTAAVARDREARPWEIAFPAGGRKGRGGDASLERTLPAHAARNYSLTTSLFSYNHSFTAWETCVCPVFVGTTSVIAAAAYDRRPRTRSFVAAEHPLTTDPSVAPPHWRAPGRLRAPAPPGDTTMRFRTPTFVARLEPAIA